MDDPSTSTPGRRALYSTPWAWFAAFDGPEAWESQARAIEVGSYLDLIEDPPAHLTGAARDVLLVSETLGGRRKVDCLGRGLLVLDVDSAPWATIEVLRSHLGGRAAIIHSTKSHGVEGKGPRFRVVLALDRPMSSAECDTLAAASKVLAKDRDGLAGLRFLLSWVDPSTLLVNQPLYPPQRTAAGLFEWTDDGERPVHVEPFVRGLAGLVEESRPEPSPVPPREGRPSSSDHDLDFARGRFDAWADTLLGQMSTETEGGRHAAINRTAFVLGQAAGAFPRLVGGTRGRLDVVAEALKPGEARTVEEAWSAGETSGQWSGIDFLDNPRRHTGSRGRAGDFEDDPGPRTSHGGSGGDGDAPPPQGDQGGRGVGAPPLIRFGLEAHRWTFELADLLGSAPVYEYTGKIVWIGEDDHGRALPVGLDAYGLIPVLTRRADFERWRGGLEGDWEPTAPTLGEVKTLLGRGQWPQVKRLRSIVRSPVLLQGGRVVDARGYDSASGVFLDTSADYPAISEDPTEEEKAEALGLVAELLGDFRYDSAGSEAAAVAMLLGTPAVRVLDGAPTPLHFVTAALPGAGKTYLVQAISTALEGRSAAPMAWRTREEERGKELFARLQAPGSFVFWDNVRDPVDSASLELAITAEHMTQRVLGEGRTASVSTDRTFVLTSNGPSFSKDTARRAIKVGLRPPPQEATTYGKPDLLEWARDNHPRLVWAVLTLWRSWYSAGRPRDQATPFPSFSRWSETVRALVIWLGYADPAGDRAFEKDGDDPREDLARLIDAWPSNTHDPRGADLVVWARFGGRARGTELTREESARLDEALALLPLHSKRDDPNYTRHLGAWLSTMSGVGNPSGKTLEAGPVKYNRSKTYRVQAEG